MKFIMYVYQYFIQSFTLFSATYLCVGWLAVCKYIGDFYSTGWNPQGHNFIPVIKQLVVRNYSIQLVNPVDLQKKKKQLSN